MSVLLQEEAEQWTSGVLVGFFPSLHLRFQQYYVNEAISFISGYGEAGQTGMSFGCRSEGRRGMALWEQMCRKVGERFSGHWKYWWHVKHKLTHKDTLQDWCHSIYGLFSLEIRMLCSPATRWVFWADFCCQSAHSLLTWARETGMGVCVSTILLALGYFSTVWRELQPQ